MNISKFTQKSLQAVQALEKTAYDFGNQEIEQEHLLYNLLHQDDSLILKLIEKMEINKDHFLNRVETALNDRVKVSGGQPYIGQYLNKALINAEDEAKAMGDEYVSVEHLFLAMLKNPSPSMKKLFQEYGITRERFLQALSTVRGNQRVTTDNPEATYDTLEKYGQDIVEKARNQKMGPVIGRDTEIRLTAGYFDAVVQCRLDTVQKMFFVDFHLFDHFQNQAVVLMQEVIQQMLLLYFLVAEIVCGLFQVLYSLQRFLCEFTDIHNRLPPYLFGC